MHEPPLFPLLKGTEFELALAEARRRVDAVVELLEDGDHEGGARLFRRNRRVRPAGLGGEVHARDAPRDIANAPTWLDEVRDPDALQMDLDALARFDRPALLTSGTESAPFFGPVVDLVTEPLARSQRVTIAGADHVPHRSVPARYVELVTTFAQHEGITAQ